MAFLFSPQVEELGRNRTFLLPSRLREGPGEGQSKSMVKFRNRDTERARELRNASSPAERHLWRYLRNKQLGARFNRQLKIGPFFPDFLCRELKFIVEVDGFSHDVQPERDVFRDRSLIEQGYRVLHFTNEEALGNVEGVVAAIQIEIERLTLP